MKIKPPPRPKTQGRLKEKTFLSFLVKMEKKKDPRRERAQMGHQKNF
jgi:hypothetical protein